VALNQTKGGSSLHARALRAAEPQRGQQARKETTDAAWEGKPKICPMANRHGHDPRDQWGAFLLSNTLQS